MTNRIINGVIGFILGTALVVVFTGIFTMVREIVLSIIELLNTGVTGEGMLFFLALVFYALLGLLIGLSDDELWL